MATNATNMATKDCKDETYDSDGVVEPKPGSLTAYRKLIFGGPLDREWRRIIQWQRCLLYKYFDKMKKYIFSFHEYNQSESFYQGKKWYRLPGLQLPSTVYQVGDTRLFRKWYGVFKDYGIEYVKPYGFFDMLGLPSGLTFKRAWFDWSWTYCTQGQLHRFPLFYSKEHYEYFNLDDNHDYRFDEFGLPDTFTQRS